MIFEFHLISPSNEPLYFRMEGTAARAEAQAELLTSQGYKVQMRREYSAQPVAARSESHPLFDAIA